VLDQAHLESRVLLAQLLHGGQDHGDRHADERHQVDAAHRRPFTCHFGSRRLDALQDVPRMLGEPAPRGGQPDPTAVRNEEAHPCFPLQYGQMLGHRRGAHARDLGDRRHRPQPPQFYQQSQPCQVHPSTVEEGVRKAECFDPAHAFFYG